MAHLGVNITTACDKRCYFCFLNLDNRMLDPKRFIDALNRLEPERVTISGGEPFMNQNLWSFLAEASKRGIGIGVISNGRALRDDTVFERLLSFSGLRLYVSCLQRDQVLLQNMRSAHSHGIDVHAHVVLDHPTFRNLGSLLESLRFARSVTLLYPTKTSSESRVTMPDSQEWRAMMSKAFEIADELELTMYYEPAFAPRSVELDATEICPAGTDPFLHVDGLYYPCCLLVDTQYGRPEPASEHFDFMRCPVLLQDAARLEDELTRRVCPLVVTQRNANRFVYPSRVDEL